MSFFLSIHHILVPTKITFNKNIWKWMKLTKQPYFTKSNYFFGSILNFNRLFDATRKWIASLLAVCVQCSFLLALRKKCSQLTHTHYSIIVEYFRTTTIVWVFSFHLSTKNSLEIAFPNINGTIYSKFRALNVSHEIHVRETLGYFSYRNNFNFIPTGRS